MKKLKSLFLAFLVLFVGLGLTACKNDDQSGKENQIITVKISALQVSLTNAYTNYVASVDAKTNEIYSKEDVYFVATSAGNKFYDSNELIELGENAVVYQYNSSEGVFEEVKLDMNMYTYKCIITNSNGYTILIGE